MVDKICDKIMNRIKAKMPEVDEERAEVIRYGLELMIGEVPKLILMFVLAICLGILKYFLISVLIICPYRIFAGGIHLKTHWACIIGTNLLYFGNFYISKFISFPNNTAKLLIAMCILVFSGIVIYLYAPADTDTVPILRKKDRQNKKIISMIIVFFIIILSFIIKDKIISNMCLIGVLLQSVTITKIAYKVFNVKLGYLEYIKNEKNAT